MDGSSVGLYSILARRGDGIGLLVDAGCGRGAHMRGTPAEAVLSRIRDHGGRVVGVDVAFPPAGNPFVDEFLPIGADGRWPVSDESADGIFSDWVLEHVDDPDSFFAECARVLKPGGFLIARTLQRWSVAAIGARATPARWHGLIIRLLQPGMDSQDVFPTRLRCNTEGQLAILLGRHLMALTAATRYRTLAGYGGRSPLLQSGLAWFESRLPESMAHAIVIEAVKLG